MVIALCACVEQVVVMLVLMVLCVYVCVLPFISCPHTGTKCTSGLFFLCAGQRVLLSKAQEITVQPSRKQEWDLDNRLHLF